MLFAVHISDGVLTLPWIMAGFLCAITIVYWSSRKVDEAEIPRIGLTAAVLFLGSQIHIPLGIASVHLLLNGVAGISVGRRAPLAIAVAMVLQSILFSHGGKLSIGVNICVLSIPAVLVYWLQNSVGKFLEKRVWLARIVVLFATAFWSALVVSAVQMMIWKYRQQNYRSLSENLGEWMIIQPIGISLIFSVVLIVLIMLTRNRMQANHYFIGLILGLIATSLSVLLNLMTILLGAEADIRVSAFAAMLAHIPIIAVESFATAIVSAYFIPIR
jgi:ABC-type Co2+ transport system permease subunit